MTEIAVTIHEGYDSDRVIKAMEGQGFVLESWHEIPGIAIGEIKAVENLKGIPGIIRIHRRV